MARGFDEAKNRKNKVASYGKALVRRSKSICEFCGESNKKLNIYELGKIEAEPNIENCIHVCDSCIDLIERVEYVEENQLRVLNYGIWSEVSIVKGLAINMIYQIKGRYPWVDDMLDMVYIDEELGEILKRIKK